MKLDLGVSKPNRTELILLLLVIDRSTLECDLLNMLSHLVPFLANSHRMLPQLGSKRLLYHQNRLKRLHVYVAEEPLKPPPHSLPCHPKGLVDFLAICPLENHIARFKGFKYFFDIYSNICYSLQMKPHFAGDNVHYWPSGLVRMMIVVAPPT